MSVGNSPRLPRPARGGAEGLPWRQDSDLVGARTRSESRVDECSCAILLGCRAQRGAAPRGSRGGKIPILSEPAHDRNLVPTNVPRPFSSVAAPPAGRRQGAPAPGTFRPFTPPRV